MTSGEPNDVLAYKKEMQMTEIVTEETPPCTSLLFLFLCIYSEAHMNPWYTAARSPPTLIPNPLRYQNSQGRQKMEEVLAGCRWDLEMEYAREGGSMMEIKSVNHQCRC